MGPLGISQTFLVRFQEIPKIRKNKNGRFPLENPLLEALGPENLTIWVNFYVESEIQVEHARFLHTDLES